MRTRREKTEIGFATMNKDDGKLRAAIKLREALSYGPTGFRALGRLPSGTMNRTEAAYDNHLRLLTHAGEIVWHKFEAIKLRLADATFYTCDFAVLTAHGYLEMHEVKGFWTDDARVKIKVAASLYPFKFIAVTARGRKNSGWQREEF